MPLPYAPPPKDSKVYRDLKNIKITSVTADQMDTLKGELFAQGVDGSEDEMRRLQLLGEVSNTQSSSGPIPGTSKIIQAEATDGEWQNESPNYGIVFQPDPGECWVYQGASAGNNSVAGSITYRLGIAAEGYVPGTSGVLDLIQKGVILISYSSSSSYFPMIESDTNSEPTYVTYENPFFMYTTNVTTGDTTQTNFYFVRVR